ncbi:hypothetical protein NX059_009993 [Plenodomus lindquistii]|nr:hypothetical protein NX059_009993 [Plenodomus lindquistii]
MPTPNLPTKTILITGASSGIGRATAIEFARSSPNSLRLILTARRILHLHALAQQIENEVGPGVRICVRRLDVSVPEQVASLIPGLPEEFRGVGCACQ